MDGTDNGVRPYGKLTDDVIDQCTAGIKNFVVAKRGNRERKLMKKLGVTSAYMIFSR